MNHQNDLRSQQSLLGVLALLTCLALAPTNISIVIAQDLPPIVVQPAAPGEPPAPAPQKPSEPTEAASEANAESKSEASSAAAESTPSQEASTASEVNTSEVTSDAEVSSLLPAEDAAAADRKNPEDSKDSPKKVEEVRTLSVEPGNQSLLPADKPAWVGAAPDYSTSQHYLYVSSLPTHEADEADAALDEPLVATIRNYIEQEVIQEPNSAKEMPVDADFIRRNLIDDSQGYSCEIATSQGPMYQKWVTVRITPEQRELFKQWHREAMQRKRLGPLGVGLVSLLAVVSLSHMVLHRRHGAKALPMVNAPNLQPVVVAKKASLFRRVVLFFFLLSIPVLVAAGLLLTLITPTHVRVDPIYIEALDAPTPPDVPVPTLHGDVIRVLPGDVEIETLGSGHRITIQHTSNQ